jgi:hypothetical protein
MRIQNLYKKGSALLFAAVFTTGMFSCQTDLLDPTPQTQIIDQFAFNTPDRIALQVNNIYTAVKNGQFLGGRYQVYGEIRADDFLNRTTNGVTGLLVWNQTVTETSQNDVISLWNAAYAAINQINVFLQGLEDNQAKFVAPVFPADYQTASIPKFKAEALFLRALSYHCLLQLYAKPYTMTPGAPGLPLRLSSETSLLNNDLARSTVSEVYAQIISDLNFAEQNLPLTYGATAATLNVTRAHRNTAIALKTRVYLTMGDYPKVVEEANKIVSAAAPFTAATGIPHALQANASAVFASPQETTESIFSFPFTAQNTPGTQNQLAFYYRSSSSAATNVNPGGGEYGLNKFGILGDTTHWPVADKRRAFAYKPTAASTEWFWGKYPSGTPYLDKAPVIRYAEVLLSLSEALVKTGGDQARATALLNAVRGRSGAALAPADGDAILAAVKLERRIEFLGEGLRGMDLLRLNEPFPAKSSIGSVPSTALNYIWPIPANELAANKLMTRNE